jgi:hypothetical protein
MNKPNARTILQEKLSKLQDQIQEIQAALDGLDRAEELAGISTNAHARTKGARDESKSNAQILVEAISANYKTIAELEKELPISRDEIRNALYQKRVQRGIKTRDLGGVKSYRYLPGKRTEGGQEEPATLRGAVLDLLESNAGDVIQTPEIASRLKGKVESGAVNFQGSVAATLSTLVRIGKIKKAKAGGYYIPV